MTNLLTDSHREHEHASEESVLSMTPGAASEVHVYVNLWR
jgi:hypothetical protein